MIYRNSSVIIAKEGDILLENVLRRQLIKNRIKIQWKHTDLSVQNYDDNNDDSPEIALVIDYTLPQCDGWWIDSGASQHMTFDKKGMHKYVASKDPLKVKLADSSIILAYEKGHIHITV